MNISIPNAARVCKAFSTESQRASKINPCRTRRRRGVFIRQNPRGDQLAEIADLVMNGPVKVYVEQTLPLAEARKAHELSQSGHARGKIVLIVD